MTIPAFITWRLWRRRALCGLLGLLALSAIACESSDNPVAPVDGGILQSGSCSGRSADMSITCQDETSTVGAEVVLNSIVADFSIGGLNQASKPFGLGAPPRQITVTGLNAGTWSIRVRVTATQRGVPLTSERTYAVNLIAQSTAKLALEAIDLLDGNDDQALERAMQRLWADLPPSSRAAIAAALRRDPGSLTAAEARVLAERFGGRFGLRSAVLMTQL